MAESWERRRGGEEERRRGGEALPVARCTAMMQTWLMAARERRAEAELDPSGGFEP